MPLDSRRRSRRLGREFPLHDWRSHRSTRARSPRRKERGMKLTVTTPLAVAAEDSGVAHLRAEDETGAFGILPGHADFLTVLSVSVATWRDSQGAEHHVALRSGMLQVRDGKTITIATREAIASDDLHRLET